MRAEWTWPSSMNYSVKFLEPTLSVCAEAVAKQDGGGRFAERCRPFRRGRASGHSGRMIVIESITASPPCVHRRIARRPSVMRAIEDGRNGVLEIGWPIQPPMLLWPKPLDLRLEHGFDRPVRRLNGDHARPGIGDTASLADALDLRTLLREFASAQD
jgi:hypothetical protein